jgi:cell division cycle 2-like protein
MGATTYSTAVDMWSVGCIFAELLLKEPLFQAKSEIELLSMIFKLLGPPTNNTWPEYSSLPLAKSISLPSPQPPQFRQKFQYMTAAGIDLLMSLLTYDPDRRITAEEALEHPYFRCGDWSCIFSVCAMLSIPEQRIAVSQAPRLVWVVSLSGRW